MRFQLIRDRADSLTIVTGERFDFSCAGEFREASGSLALGIELTVDLVDTRYIDSAALGMLLLLGEKTGGTHKVRIRNAKGQPKEALEQANFDRLFTIL